MATWHQMQAFKRDGFPKLSHPTQWTAYSTRGHLSVMRFDSEAQCDIYCKNTGDSKLPPDNMVRP